MDSERAPIVTVEWLRERLGRVPGLRVVDARPFDAYRAAHIPGAAHSDQNLLRLPDSAPDSIARFDETIGREIRRLGIHPGDRTIFYEDFSGTAAARGVWMLDYAGVGCGAVLDGGLSAWVTAGGALTRDEPHIEPSDTVIVPESTVLATADEIRAAVTSGTGALRVLDTRNALEFMGGTIPTATHVDWVRHLDAQGMFKPLPELRALYESAGLSPSDATPLATFCGSGYRAAHTYVVLKALGFPAVKNYVPSWGEWGQRGDVPVERPGRGT